MYYESSTWEHAMSLLKLIWLWNSLPAAATINTHLSYRTGMPRNTLGNGALEKCACLICRLSQDRHATIGIPGGGFPLPAFTSLP